MDDLLGAFDGRQLALEGVGNGPLPRNVDVSVNKGGDRFEIELVNEGNSSSGKREVISLSDKLPTIKLDDNGIPVQVNDGKFKVEMPPARSKGIGIVSIKTQCKRAAFRC